MAIVKGEHVLKDILLTFNLAGDVVDASITVSYVLRDNVTGIIETQVGKTQSVWADLIPGHQVMLDTLGKRLKVLAETF